VEERFADPNDDCEIGEAFRWPPFRQGGRGLSRERSQKPHADQSDRCPVSGGAATERL